jgi:hypothetical protein
LDPWSPPIDKVGMDPELASVDTDGGTYARSVSIC